MKLKSILIQNFCGISEFATSFNDKGFQISGANGLGKTTIFRAIAWVLNGTDEFGNRINPGFKAKVKLNIERQSKDLIELEHKIFDNASHCYMNGNHLKITDFESSIKNFSFNGYDPLLFLNPAFLPSLHWKQQRNLVEQLVDMPDNDDLAYEVSQKNGLERICEVMNTGHTVEQIKKQARDRYKKLDLENTKIDAIQNELIKLASEGVLADNVARTREREINSQRHKNIDARAKEQQLLDELETFEFERAKLLQDKLNELFNDNPIYFSLFQENKKGEFKETCQLTYNERTWNQLSTGEKIKAGLHLIKVFQQQFGVDSPIIIDNYESITESGELQLPEISSQQVRLKATEEGELNAKK